MSHGFYTSEVGRPGKAQYVKSNAENVKVGKQVTRVLITSYSCDLLPHLLPMKVIATRMEVFKCTPTHYVGMAFGP